MSIIVDCPSCSRKLRVPEDLLGTRVKCPTCGGTFDAVAAPTEEVPPSPSATEVAALPPPESPSEPRPDAPPAEQPPRPDASEENEEDDDRPWERPYHRYMRRDSEPHRGGLILTLGIVSIVLAAMSIGAIGSCSVVGLPLGIAAWVMGGRDLKKIRGNVMDPRGEGSTQAGWICGIVGTCLSTICGLGFLAYVAFITAMVSGAFK
jgi:predicted Zn finger-like uncharacterized protein